MPTTLAKYEVLIKQYLCSILDISAGSPLRLQLFSTYCQKLPTGRIVSLIIAQYNGKLVMIMYKVSKVFT